MSVQWLDSSDKAVASDGIIHVNDLLVVGNTTIASLVFSPLGVVHDGSYTCHVEVQYSSSERTVVEETKVIAVHSKLVQY